MSGTTFCFGTGKSNRFKRSKRPQLVIEEYQEMEFINLGNETFFHESPFEQFNNFEIGSNNDVFDETIIDSFDVLHPEIEKEPEIEIELNNVDFSVIQFNLYLNGSMKIQGNENNVSNTYYYHV